MPNPSKGGKYVLIDGVHVPVNEVKTERKSSKEKPPAPKAGNTATDEGADNGDSIET